ncbi:MAG: choice-of-anchor tandem repeat GloVer-containing protein [Candidatus Cybelea sp.]
MQRSASGKPAASSENVLYRFKGGMDGSSPQAALTEVNGTLFGTTEDGGGSYCILKSVQSGCGTIFSIDALGSEYTVVHRYPDTGTGGAGPLTLTYSGGQFYGTTVVGGNLSCGFGGGCGTVFTMDPSGASYNVLYSFASLQDGQRPETSLLDLKGTLYGTTSLGGSGKCYFTSGLVGCGTLYKVNVSSGKKRILYNFQGGKDGYFPRSYGLIDLHGMLYGTAVAGGVLNCVGDSALVGCGTIFKIRPSGDGYRVVYRFKGPNGSGRPNNILDVNGTLYGTTANGGMTFGQCVSVGCGTLFKFDITSRRLTVLYRFRGGKDGEDPNSLLAYSNGALYSTTVAGGDSSCQGSFYGNGCGTVFKFDLASGRETILYRFKGGRDGAVPRSGVIEVNGVLYGTTAKGGKNDNGTVFSLSPSRT